MRLHTWLPSLAILALLTSCAPAAQPLSDATVGASPTALAAAPSTHPTPTPWPTPTKDCAGAPLRTLEPRADESEPMRKGRELRTWRVMGADIPGLGGYYENGGRGEGQSVTILMTDPTQQHAAEEAAKRIFGERFAEFAEVKVLKVDYTLADLARWYACLSDVVHAYGARMTDLNEGRNRLQYTFAAAPGLRRAVEAAISATGVPLDAVIINVGCPTGRPYQPPQPDFSIDDVQPLRGAVEVRVSAPKSASVGQAVSLALSVVNVSDKTVTVKYGEGSDFVVTTPDGRTVWNALCNTGINDILLHKDLAPGESLDFSKGWPLWDGEGEYVVPGDYLVYGVFDVREGWASQPARITITP